MKIKDFKPGQEVFVLTREKGRQTEHFVKKYTVTSVGRKYVKATPQGTNWPVEFYKRHDEENFLVENKDWGNPAMLFATEEALNDDIEKDMLQTWLRKATEYSKVESYTLEQLRAVRRILEES